MSEIVTADDVMFWIMGITLVSLYIVCLFVNIWIMLVMLWLIFDNTVGWLLWPEDLRRDIEHNRKRQKKHFKVIQGGKDDPER